MDNDISMASTANFDKKVINIIESPDKEKAPQK